MADLVELVVVQVALKAVQHLKHKIKTNLTHIYLDVVKNTVTFEKKKKIKRMEMDRKKNVYSRTIE